MSDNIRPCPLCYSKAVGAWDMTGNGKRYVIKCTNVDCGCHVSVVYGRPNRCRFPVGDVYIGTTDPETAKQKAIENWNKALDISNRERQIIESFRIQNERLKSNDQMVLNTLRGISVTLGMIYDKLNCEGQGEPNATEG